MSLLVHTVVLLAEKGALTAARVVDQQGARPVIELLSGDRFAVTLDRLYWVSRQSAADRAALESHLQQVAALVPSVNLEAAWEALATPPDPLPIDTIAALALPETAPADLRVDATVSAIFADPIHFRIRSHTLSRESPATVALARQRLADEAAQARALALAIAAFQARRTSPDTSPDTSFTSPTSPTSPTSTTSADTSPEARAAVAHFEAALLDVALFGRESKHFASIRPLTDALGFRPDQALDLLIALGVLAPDVNLAPLRAALPGPFSPDLLAEADRLLTHTPRPPRDLTHLDALAIDDAETTEVDDAFALDGPRVYVLVSDAAAFIAPDSPLDREARTRATTVYLPEGKRYLLPPQLAEGPLSLTAGAPRTALALSFEFAPDGRPIAFELERARVHIRRQLTYREADRLLAAPALDAQHGPLLAAVARLMDRHRALRHARGAVTLQRPELVYVRAPDGRVTPQVGDPLAPSRLLIQELAIIACTEAAVFCAERQIPCIYRTQAAPDGPPPPTDPRTGRIDDPAQQHDLLRRMKPSTLQLDPAPHWSLGAPAYTQITSPIRRYVDLLMHQQLLGFLRTGRPPLSAAHLHAALNDLQRQTTTARRVEQETRRFYALRYLEQTPHLTLDGLVARDLGKRALIEFPTLGLQEVTTLKRRRAPGTALRFSVISVSSRNNSLELRELT